MGKELLENIKDDDDTVVIMDSIETEELEEKPVPELMEDDSFILDAPVKKEGSRFIYAAAMILAVASGTITGILGVVTAFAANATDISGWDKKALDEMVPYTQYYGTFSGAHAQEDFITSHIIMIIAATAVFLAALVVLCIETGRFSRDENGRIRLNLFDRLWSELQIAAGVCAALGAIYLSVPIFELVPNMGLIKCYTPLESTDYVFGIRNSTVFALCTIGMAAGILIAVICFVTLIKKIKARELIRCSLLGKVLKLLGVSATYAGKGAVRAGSGLASAGRGIRGAARVLTVPEDTDRKAAIKIIFKYVLIAFALIFLPWAALMFFNNDAACFFAMILSFIISALLIIRKVGKLAEIRAGVIEVKSGNLTHKITVNTDENGPKTDLDKLASDINHISEATNAAVQNEIKNQRLKTDLISNVSHDLKTPLTSMISYLDILEKEGLDSPDAPAHLAVVKEKTERLKTLTEELFEAAKASSGNIPCEIEDIDLAALIDQSLAEMGDRLSKKNLKIRKNIKTDNTMVRADGKLLYRVFENLLSNISKYALDSSRVYIDVSEVAPNKNGSAVAGGKGKLLVEVKNISKDELNISAEELMERFTRGDSSRNTEGSGLGLAIAKDLTTLMGGVFEVSIDGDMFKASVMLDRV